MALRNSVSAAACVMVGLTLIGNMIKGSQDGSAGGSGSTASGAIAATDTARPALAGLPARAAPATVATVEPVVTERAAGIDDTPTGSIDPSSGLHRPNPAAYGDAAKQGSSLVLTGAEAINYLAGNTLRREGPGEPLHFTYFASRGVAADGSERSFVARVWNRDGSDLCETGADGAPVCRPIRILLDAKEELQGGRLGTVTIGDGASAELVKGNVLHVPSYIPFLDGTVALDAASDPKAPPTAGWPGVVDHTAEITAEAGGGRHFVYYGADNRLLDVQPVESGAAGGRAVKVVVGHWHLAKSTLCEMHGATGAAQTCFKPEPVASGGVRLVPASKGGQALRVSPLPETRIRAVAQD